MAKTELIDREGFPRRVRRAREKAGLFREDVAKKMPISVASIASYEDGKHLPYFGTFLSLCRLYNVSPRWVLTGKDGCPSDDYSVEFFIRNMYNIRIRRGLSQEALGNFVWSNQRLISLYERRIKEPTLDTAVLIAWALDTDFEFMLGRH